MAEKTAITNTVKSYLRTQTNDTLIALANLIPYWEEDGTYTKGDPVKVANGESYSLYTAIQSHEALNDPNRAPTIAPALWAVYHAKAAQYALPWVAPTHAEDIYRQGEFMIWPDANGNVYECLQDTDRAPDVLPGRWRKIEDGGGQPDPNPEPNPEPNPDPDPDPGPEPEPEPETNSNGTAVWSEWMPWNHYNETLYQIGDRVTKEGVRYIATLGNNHYDPASGTGWAVAPE